MRPIGSRQIFPLSENFSDLTQGIFLFHNFPVHENVGFFSSLPELETGTIFA